jgi:hypothetical protein
MHRLGAGDVARRLLNNMRSGIAVVSGARGFITPQPVAPWFQPGGTIEATSSGDPSCAFASVHDPGRIDDPSPIVGFVDATPTPTTAKASASQLFRGYHAASAPAAYASRMVFPTIHARLASGRLACLYREGVEPSGSR